MTAVKSTAEGSFLVSQIEQSYLLGVVIDGAARDAGNSPTTTLRPGLIMAQVTASKKYKQYDVAGTDGTEVPVGVLSAATKVIDADGANQDQTAVLVAGGILKQANLILLDTNARRVMRERGFIFDDELTTEVPTARKVNLAAATQALTAAQSGQKFVGAVDAVFTLPAAAPALKGVWYEFETGALSSGTGLSISPAAADHIRGNGLTAVDDKDLINTGATDRLGDMVRIYCDGVDGWVIDAVIGTWAKQA
jgi:hypothetical protein